MCGSISWYLIYYYKYYDGYTQCRVHCKAPSFPSNMFNLNKNKNLIISKIIYLTYMVLGIPNLLGTCITYGQV